MPIYDTYDGIDGGVPPATASTDSEYKYVNVRRYDLAEEDDDGSRPQAVFTADDGSGTQGPFDDTWVDGIKGEGDLTKASPHGDGITDFNLGGQDASATGHAGGGGGPHVKVLDGADGGTAPDLVVETDPAAAIGSPTTVLAWARADPISQSDGGTAPDLVVETDPGVPGPVAVLAWARGDNTTPLAGGDDAPGEVTGEPMPGALDGGGAQDILIGGTTSYDEPDGQTFNGGVFVGAGDVGSGDDVVVDGRIITGQDPAAAERELFDLLGFQDDLDARGEILTLGFTAMDWGAAAADAGGLQDVHGDGSVRFDPF